MQSEDIELAIFHAARLGGRAGVEKRWLVWYCNFNGDYSEGALDATVERMVNDNVLQQTDEGKLKPGSQWREHTQSDALRMWHMLDQRAAETDDRLQLTEDDLHDLRATLRLEQPIGKLLEILTSRGVLYPIDEGYAKMGGLEPLSEPIDGADTFI
jgi:hypothetical protein